MGKLLKRVRHGVYLICTSANKVAANDSANFKYFYKLKPLNLASNYREAMTRDFQNIGADAKSAVSKLHVEQA